MSFHHCAPFGGLGSGGVGDSTVRHLVHDDQLREVVRLLRESVRVQRKTFERATTISQRLIGVTNMTAELEGWVWTSVVIPSLTPPHSSHQTASPISEEAILASTEEGP